MLTALGKELRMLRLNCGDLLKDMADKLSMTPAYLSSIENGKRNPPKNLVASVAEAYYLEDNEIEKLNDAYFLTQEEIAINLSKSTPSQKELGLTFARKFNSLNPTQVQNLITILNKR